MNHKIIYNRHPKALSPIDICIFPGPIVNTNFDVKKTSLKFSISSLTSYSIKVIGFDFNKTFNK